MHIGIAVGIPATPLAASSGPTVASRLAELNAFDATISTWNPADDTTASKSSARLSTVAVTAGGPIGQVFDQKGSNHSVAPTDAQRPVNTDGATWDGAAVSGDELAFTATLPTTFDVGMLYKGTDTAGIGFSSTGSGNFALCWQDGAASGTSSGAGTATAYVDGVSQATRDLLHLAAADGSVHRLEARAVTGSAFPSVLFSGYSASSGIFRIAGILSPLWVLDPSQADIADARIAAAAYYDAVVAELGLGN